LAILPVRRHLGDALVSDLVWDEAASGFIVRAAFLLTFGQQSNGCSVSHISSSYRRSLSVAVSRNDANNLDHCFLTFFS